MVQAKILHRLQGQKEINTVTCVNEFVRSKKEALSNTPATVQFAIRSECFAFEDHKHLYTK